MVLVLVTLMVVGAGCTAEDQPEPGTTHLSVFEMNESVAMEQPPSERATFENLTSEQRAVFERAVECDCQVEQDAFGFGESQEVSVVNYRGEYYGLHVVVV